jgi:SAM-dependent methyltransferase
MATQSHQSDPRVLNQRTLERDHSFLASILRPGMNVLDAGCGTGAITAGIAPAVGANGRVTGVDRDVSLLAIARQELPGIEFVEGDVVEGLPFDGEFDVVNAARTLQWVADPRAAIASLVKAAKPGGLVVALDYDHAYNEWNPKPGDGFRTFYVDFLDWRFANGWSNTMGSQLGRLFEQAGLRDVAVYDASEVSRDPERLAMWLHVIESIGPRMQAAGYGYDADRAAAEYREWMSGAGAEQTLSLRAAIGVKVP